MKFTFRSNSNKTSLYPLQPVLNSGLIMYARSYANEMRTVTFEDPAVASQVSHNTYCGKGTDFITALTQALTNFHTSNETNKVIHLPINDLGIGEEFVEKLGKRIDVWLLKHQGLIRAFTLNDGTVQIELEGFAVPSDFRSRILLEGNGKSFYSAFLNAVQEFPERVTELKNLLTS
jgi:hypothetical protein